MPEPLSTFLAAAGGTLAGLAAWSFTQSLYRAFSRAHDVASNGIHSPHHDLHRGTSN